MSGAVERFLSSNDEVHEHDVLQIHDAWKTKTLEDSREIFLSQATCPLAYLDLSFLTLGICATRLPGSAVMRRLPNEIWFYVFSFLVSVNPIPSSQHHVTLSLVCHRWHDIAKAFRRPPPTLYVAHKIPSSDAYKWVSKDDQPFALCIPEISPRTYARSPNGLLHLPAAKCHALSLSYCPSTPWLLMTVDNLTTSWIFLQTLKLSIPNLRDPDNFQSELFASAINLWDVEIHCKSKIPITIPKTSLLRYREHCVSSVNNLYTLKNSPKLSAVDYTITHHGYTQHLALQWGRQTFPQLVYVDIKVYVSQPGQLRILKTLSLPKLKKLRVSMEYDDLIDDLVAMFIFSSGSLFTKPPSPTTIPLTHLAFYSGRPIKEGELVALLFYTPVLVSLECGPIPTSDLAALGLPTANRTWTCLAPKLTTLIIHDPDDVQPFATLARSNYLLRRPFRTIKRIQLLYREKKQRRIDAFSLGISRPDDVVYVILEDQVNKITDIMLDSRDRSVNSDAVRFPLKLRRSLEHVLERIENIQGLSPESIPLSIIQTIFSLSVVEPHCLPGPNPTDLQRRAKELYTKLLMVFQLKVWQQPAWAAPGLHSLVFEYLNPKDHQGWKPDQPTEHDLLYGKFKPPSREEVLWPYEDCYHFGDGWLLFDHHALQDSSESKK
ncbi:hypothetical protein BJ165DRAFT_1501598 [Panaeolus papilionaceus]|nr:hypothetical protein BJ165DRAFT_1501598 [Panaeolus papilionaceus]